MKDDPLQNWPSLGNYQSQPSFEGLNPSSKYQSGDVCRQHWIWSLGSLTPADVPLIKAENLFRQTEPALIARSTNKSLGSRKELADMDKKIEASPGDAQLYYQRSEMHIVRYAVDEALVFQT